MNQEFKQFIELLEGKEAEEFLEHE